MPGCQECHLERSLATLRWSSKSQSLFDPLLCSPQRTRPIPLWSVHVATEESHRRALALQRATVRGTPSVRSSDHPTPTLEYEQLRLPVMLRWLVGFGTILPVLAMLILHTASRCQVVFPLTARPACTQPRLTARCAPCAVGACLPLPFNHHTTRTTWLGSATTCSRAGACPVHHVHRGGAGAGVREPEISDGAAGARRTDDHGARRRGLLPLARR